MVHSRWLRRIAFLTVIAFAPAITKAQSEFKGLEHLFTTPQSYMVYHTSQPPVIDGNINELVWQQVAWTNEFVDIEGDKKPRPAYPTKVKMLWDDSCLYIAARVTDPNVWATLRKHDDIIFYDNDFEVFLNPNNNTQPYFEIETNALNTVFDLLLNKPYRNDGTPIINWDVKGMRSAVKIQGTMNNASDTDEGWTVEMAIPYKAVSLGNNVQVPREGTLWRINFSRVEWDTKVVDGKYVKQRDARGRPLPEHNWVWSPQGVVNMHYPERWGYLLFSRQPVNSVTFNLPYAEQQKRYLWLIYYREKQWYIDHQEYAVSLDKLGLNDHISIDKKDNTLQLEATKHQFFALIRNVDGKSSCTINQDGLTQQLTD